MEVGNILFAEWLYDTLQRKGIRCWLDAHDLDVGNAILMRANQAVRLHDKVVQCCSRESLTSAWMDNELKVTFAKEEQQAQMLLLPLDLDGYLSGEYEGPFAARIRERLAVDFVGWDKGPEKFEKQVENVVRALASDAGSE